MFAGAANFNSFLCSSSKEEFPADCEKSSSSLSPKGCRPNSTPSIWKEFPAKKEESTTYCLQDEVESKKLTFQAVLEVPSVGTASRPNIPS